MLRSAVALLLLTTLSLAAQNAPVYKDANAPLEKRVDDLLSRMTLEEKVVADDERFAGDRAPRRPGLQLVERVPARRARAGTRHGVPAGRSVWRRRGTPTCIFRMATAISDEARAKHHEFVRQGKRGIYQGLTFWTPNINLLRDPRWGRGMETYGEDPVPDGPLGVQFIRGCRATIRSI